MSERPLDERDPLVDLVSRGIGRRIERVDAEPLAPDGYAERRRVRFVSADGPGSVLFVRSPRGERGEAQLLPFLARRTDRVPIVHARGIPPDAAPNGPWLLLEDVLGGAPACDGEVADIVLAKLAVERAVARDAPALRALGVRDDPRPLPAALAGEARVLLHGGLRCASALRLARGVVLFGWSGAAFGPSALDAASLALDLRRAGREGAAEAVRRAWVAEAGSSDASFAAAEGVVA